MDITSPQLSNIITSSLSSSTVNPDPSAEKDMSWSCSFALSRHTFAYMGSTQYTGCTTKAVILLTCATSAVWNSGSAELQLSRGRAHRKETPHGMQVNCDHSCDIVAHAQHLNFQCCIDWYLWGQLAAPFKRMEPHAGRELIRVHRPGHSDTEKGPNNQTLCSLRRVDLVRCRWLWTGSLQ